VTGFFNLSVRKYKKFQKFFSVFAIFSLILQIGSGIFLYRPVLSEEGTTQTSEQTQTVIETAASLQEPAPELTVTETPLTEPTPALTVMDSLTPTETQAEPATEPILNVDQPQSQPEVVPKTNIVLDLGPSGTDAQSAQLKPEITTDKADYAPEETVTISGSNFPANTTLLIKVTRPDGSVVKGDGSFTPGSDEVTTDAEGKFTYFYKLDGIEGEYKVEVFQGEDILATTSFNDSSKPDLVVEKSNNVGGTITLGGTFIWKIRVKNQGSAKAVFSNNKVILEDNLPLSGATYGSPSVVYSGVTGTVNCTLVSGDLSCKASGTVEIPPAKYFEVSFAVTPAALGTLKNPRVGCCNQCKVDPNNEINESNGSNNNCYDEVRVSLPWPDLWNVPLCHLDPTGEPGVSPGELDLDGPSTNNPAASYLWTDDYLFLRERVDKNPGSPGNFHQYAWTVLVQTTPPKYQYLISLDGLAEKVKLIENPQATAIPVSWSPIFNDPADGPVLWSGDTSIYTKVVPDGSDYYIMFAVPRSVLTAWGIAPEGTMLFFATSADANNFNKDHLDCYEIPAPYCGDGAVNQQDEQCDDGNNINGDGCSSQCVLEGKIIIKKQTTPNTDTTTEFTFTPSYGSNFNLANGQTNDSGYLLPGSYTVTEQAKIGWGLSGLNCTESKTQNTAVDFNNRRANIVLDAGEEVYCVFENTQRGSISGYKYEDINGNGQEDEGETGRLAGWTIELKQGDSEIDSTTTGVDGTYSFTNVVPGNYQVCEVNQTGWWVTDPNEGDAIKACKDVSVFTGQNSEVNFGNFELGQITACKYNDLDGDGVKDVGEPGIAGVTMTLEKWVCRESDGFFDMLFDFINGPVCGWETIEVGNTEEGGCYKFSNLTAGDYRVGEFVPDGYYNTSPAISDTITVQSGTNETVNFLNARYGSIGDFVWEDLNGNGLQDDGATGIAGVTVNLYLDDGDGVFEPGTDDGLVGTKTTDGVGGSYLFENLVAGHYWVDIDETTVPAGYSLTTANDPMLVILAPGENELGADFGYLPQPPSISLTKTNDHSSGASAGNTVNYTLTLTNGPVALSSVVVTDVMPSGFSYVLGSGQVDGVLLEPTISGNVLTWTLSLVAGQVRMITYQAKIDSSQPAGTYYNLATCRGLSAREQTVNCPLVDSSVSIGSSFSYSASIGGTTIQVLGAATEVTPAVLGAATGSETYWLLMAILMIILGIILRNFEKFRKFGFLKIRKYLLSLCLFVFLLLVSIQNVFASGLTVRITKLPEYKNTSNFKLYYTALQIDGKPISAQFYYRKEGDVWRFVGGPLSGETGWVETSGTEIGSEGKYYFKVVASSEGETVEDETSTIVDWTPPAAPGEYSKERINSNTYRLKWRTPNNDDFSRVLVYRSKEQNFTADSGTLVVEVGGAKDTLITWEDTGLEIGKDYYYALRSVDRAGNISVLVGDGGTVDYVEVTPTPAAATAGAAAGARETVSLPKEEAKEGEILGGATEAPTPTETPTTPSVLGGATETVSKFGAKAIFAILGAVLVLGALGYSFFRRKT